jgi:hypothetical protein
MTGNGETVEDNMGKANILNEYFHAVFTKENLHRIPSPMHDREEGNEFTFRKITESEILKKLKNLKVNKAPGPDHCHPRILKEIADAIVIPLLIIFNQSITTGTVPDEWKRANITPIHKKGERTNPKNYRPVSLTSILCKMLESCLRDQLMKYMNDNSLFSPDQHGFLPNKSCVTQLLLIMEHWTQLIDDGNCIDTIYLDFSKAFDSVPHNRLLIKLKNFGMCDLAINWFRSFLTNRIQRVCLEGSHSEWKHVTSGVPQGSVLGPILFLIYINDLPNSIKNFVKIFADDTKLYSINNQVEHCISLQADIDQAYEWSQTWQLPFNAEKCKVMHIGKNSLLNNYTMKNTNGDTQQLEVVNEEKDLGVIFDQKLSFNTHISTCIAKANQILGIIKRNFSALDQISFILLYKTLVRSHLEYANAVWRPNLKKHINQLEKVQRRATKCIPSLQNLPYEERLQRLKLPSLEYRRARGDMIQTYKILNNIDALDPGNFFELCNNNRTRGNSQKIVKQRFKTEIRKNVFSNRVVNNWNSLPESVISAPSLNSFKNRLDKEWADRMYIF